MQIAALPDARLCGKRLQKAVCQLSIR